MVCYGPRLSTVVLACAAAYALLHQVIRHILHIAGLVMQVVLIIGVAVAAAVLLTRTVRGIQRRRAAAGACTTCRFRCQQPLGQRPQRRPARAGQGAPVLLPVPSVPRATVIHDGYVLTPDGVTGTSTGRPEGTATAQGRPLILD
jgi:hypothetical protein